MSKSVKETQERELKKYQAKRVEDLTAFAKQAEPLYKKAVESEKSARELGDILLKVKKYIKTHNWQGGWQGWVEQYIGDDESTLNRCKYALSLADPDSTRSKRKDEKKHSSNTVYRAVKEIRKAASGFEKAVNDGDTGKVETLRTTIINVLDELIKRAAYTMMKKGRKLLLDKLAASSDPKKKAIGLKALAAEFSERTLMKEDGRFVPEEKAVAATNAG